MIVGKEKPCIRRAKDGQWCAEMRNGTTLYGRTISEVMERLQSWWLVFSEGVA